MPSPQPPVCDYEGSDYQDSFWEKGGREYEDLAEAAALRRLLPPAGGLMLELGAGAGRNTLRYAGFRRVALVDFSHTQLLQAQARLGPSDRYIYVAADVYRLPFADGTFDAATMIRVLHHMADAPRALKQVHAALGRDAVFILEFANKRNLKAILRYLLRRQTWNPFTLESVEFASLNFDFHPRKVRQWLEEAGFRVERQLAVSHFRLQALKRLLPASLLAWADSLLQPIGAAFPITPSLFYRLRGGSVHGPARPEAPTAELFKCPECGSTPLVAASESLACAHCGRHWAISDGIYDFRRPRNQERR